MKNLRQFCTTIVLTLTLTVLTFAGDMHTPAPTQPSDPTPATTEGVMSTPVAGDIHTTGSEEAAAGDSVVADALSLLQSVLSLL